MLCHPAGKELQNIRVGHVVDICVENDCFVAASVAEYRMVFHVTYCDSH